jgi:Integrase core domain
MAHNLQQLAGRSRRARSAARQHPRRTAELRVRTRAAELSDEIAGRGRPRKSVAQRLRLSRRTLARWRRARRQSRGLVPRGRPCRQSDYHQRKAVLDVLHHEGPHLGLPTLRGLFPVLSRCELRDLQADYRQALRATCRVSTEELTWHRPGRVWSVDHTEPPQPIGAAKDAILSVRDLASGMQLAWLPVTDVGAATTLIVLSELFDRHGPPLVLKSDNGSAFKSQPLDELLTRRAVLWLPSPPRTPRYNGSCEAGIGQMQIRTQHFAALAGRPGEWNEADLAAARRQANDIVRREHHKNPTASELWHARQPITPQERDQLQRTFADHREQIIADLTDFDSDNRHHIHQVLRQALRRALLDLGLLTITRRSIPLPIKLNKRDMIS